MQLKFPLLSSSDLRSSRLYAYASGGDLLRLLALAGGSIACDARAARRLDAAVGASISDLRGDGAHRECVAAVVNGSRMVACDSTRLYDRDGRINVLFGWPRRGCIGPSPSAVSSCLHASSSVSAERETDNQCRRSKLACNGFNTRCSLHSSVRNVNSRLTPPMYTPLSSL